MNLKKIYSVCVVSLVFFAVDNCLASTPVMVDSRIRCAVVSTVSSAKSSAKLLLLKVRHGVARCCRWVCSPVCWAAQWCANYRSRLVHYNVSHNISNTMNSYPEDPLLVLPQGAMQEIKFFQVGCVRQGGENSGGLVSACGIHSLYNALQFLLYTDIVEAQQQVKDATKVKKFINDLKDNNTRNEDRVCLENCNGDDIRNHFRTYCQELSVTQREKVKSLVVVDTIASLEPGNELFLCGNERAAIEGFRNENVKRIVCVVHNGAGHWVAMIADRQEKKAFIVDSSGGSDGIVTNGAYKILLDQFVRNLFL